MNDSKAATDEPGGVGLPKWFLWVCGSVFSVLIGLVVPWADSIASDLKETKNNIIDLRIKMGDQKLLQRDIEYLRDSVGRIEKRIETLEHRP